MPTDIRQYWQELAKKAGIPESTSARVLEALGDETVAKAMAEGFVARPDYSRDLDRTRDEVAAKTKQEYQAWYEREVKPGYEANFRLAQEADRYRTLYGPLDDGSGAPGGTRPGGGGGNGGGNGGGSDAYITREQMKAMLDEQGRVYVGLTKVLGRIQADYTQRFGGILNLDEVEKIAAEHNIPADIAYERYIAPKVAEQEKTKFEAAIKAAREEGARDARSRSHTPVDSASREGHPLYDPYHAPKEDNRSADRRSLDAFAEGWQEAVERTPANP